MSRTIVWSYGGGIQSAAIGVLIREGVLPVPDLAGIADTGRERRTTWDYLRDVMQPYLDPVGLKIEIVPHTLAHVDLYAKDGLTLLPAYTKEGRLSLFLYNGRVPLPLADFGQSKGWNPPARPCETGNCWT